MTAPSPHRFDLARSRLTGPAVWVALVGFVMLTIALFAGEPVLPFAILAAVCSGLLFAVSRPATSSASLLAATVMYCGTLLFGVYVLGFPPPFFADLVLPDPAAVPADRLATADYLLFQFNRATPFLFYVILLYPLLPLINSLVYRPAEA